MADEARPPYDRRSNTDVSFQTYIDARLAEVQHAADLAATIPTEVVPLREYIVELISNLKNYFVAIMDEQRRGMLVAEQEREKAARALRNELARAIEEGDRNLQQHIMQQVGQIREALESQERLDLQRHETCDRASAALGQRIDDSLDRGIQRLEGLRREIELIQGAAADAVAKAEAANEKRFESVNEFRAQLTDQTASFLPREVADASFGEIRRAIAEINEKLSKLV